MPHSIETYKLITGKDDSEFCRRITEKLSEGYELYGYPTMTFNGEHVVVGQAVIKRPARLV
ncbi:DUF1737 domain-containing protein [Psychromonas algarum]|uniref:DUF1737 domain-containing protein n=1 Tax=Psychromonas algarum TaxID=2555643 RepID=UPI001ABB8D93|nr:DUF1737 domain-containing protein [Psychromonas sp. RZ22]